MSTDLEHEAVKRRMLDVVGEAVAGSDWAPPSGGVVTEAVVVLLWMMPDGSTGMNYVGATNHAWSTEGLLRGALRRYVGEEDECH